METEQRANGDKNSVRTGPSQPNADFPTGIGAPATRALIGAGYRELEQLAGVPVADLKALHGMGPKALARLQEALNEQGLSLR